MKLGLRKSGYSCRDGDDGSSEGETGRGAEQSTKRLPSWSISVAVSESRSAMPKASERCDASDPHNRKISGSLCKVGRKVGPSHAGGGTAVQPLDHILRGPVSPSQELNMPVGAAKTELETMADSILANQIGNERDDHLYSMIPVWRRNNRSRANLIWPNPSGKRASTWNNASNARSLSDP